MEKFSQKDITDILVGFKQYIKDPTSIGINRDSIRSICTSKESGSGNMVYIFNPDKIQTVYNSDIDNFNKIKFENIEEFTNEKYFDKDFLSISECEYNLKKIDCIFSLVDLTPNFRSLFYTYYKLKYLVWNTAEDIKDNLIEFSDKEYMYNISLVSIESPIKHTAWKIAIKQDRADIKFHTHIISVINQISKRMNGYCSMKLSENVYIFYVHHIDPSLITPTWRIKTATTTISDLEIDGNK